ncbi:MAG: hypothetical protein V1790_17635 [Planctomycetota bacterium]
MPVIIFGKRCKLCSHYIDPRELIGDVRSGYLCWACHERHNKALKVLCLNPPRGCQECGVTFAHLKQVNPEVRMKLHYKDAILQVLCLPCSAKYEPKRRDLYGSTQYGHIRGLK